MKGISMPNSPPDRTTQCATACGISCRQLVNGAPLGLNHLGLLAPGKQADIVLLSDARKVTVQQVLVKGEPIDAQTLQAEESARLAQSARRMVMPLPANQFPPATLPCNLRPENAIGSLTLSTTN